MLLLDIFDSFFSCKFLDVPRFFSAHGFLETLALDMKRHSIFDENILKNEKEFVSQILRPSPSPRWGRGEPSITDAAEALAGKYRTLALLFNLYRSYFIL
jgi:hypothetical protein